MKISAHQANFLPYPGFFYKMKNSDIFVLADNLQFTKKEWQNRNRIILDKRIEYLTVPVKKGFPLKLNGVEIANQKWYIQLLRRIKNNYRESQLLDELEQIFRMNNKLLINLNISLIKWVKEKLRIKTKMILMSRLNLINIKDPNERIVKMVKELGGGVYLAGEGGKNYMDLDFFKKSNIKVEWSNWKAKNEYDYLSILQFLLEGRIISL